MIEMTKSDCIRFTIACKSDDVCVVRECIKKVNRNSDEYCRDLYKAIENRSFKVIRFLLENYSDDETERILKFWAWRLDNLEMIRLLLSCGVEMMNAHPYYKRDDRERVDKIYNTEEASNLVEYLLDHNPTIRCIAEWKLRDLEKLTGTTQEVVR